ncbi:MAG: glycoside hydrolase family 27 protein, partial [Acidobacteriaceae bacterium]
DSYGLTITEQQFKQNVDWLHTHLQPSGWQYVVIDEGWYLASPQKADQGYTVDANGRYVPAVDRFPSADKDRGFKPLADYVHSLGLKFGIHIIRGIPKEAVARNLPIAGSNYRAAEAADTSDTCRWNNDNYGVRDNAAGQAYYDSIAKLYAGWGVDFVKIDCISQPYKTASIHMVSRALKKTGRPIVLSLSPGPTPLADASDVVQQAQMWRISDDFWDVWNRDTASGDFPQSVVHQFPLLAQWERYAGPGHWPDADMLPIGWLGPQPGWQQARSSRLTPDETRTVLTLWAIARSPLILGANLTRMDGVTESMLTNREVVAVDQDSTGNQARLHTKTTWVWTARATSAKGEYVALFNVSDAPIDLSYTWHDLGISSGKHQVHDLWLHRVLDQTQGIKVTLTPHASVLYRVE